ncbi:MAG: Lrp/AsnC ligand binding domain-containing protein [Aestuariivita sp.]|nr:Lrp/AsnC ligand binding domain-containing protein [Aestuariivita sp.]
MKNSEIDRFDTLILQALSQEGRLTVTELSKRVGLSKTPCQVRMKRLLSERYILGFKAVLNPAKVSLEQVLFVEVKLKQTNHLALSEFNEAALKITEIEQCHMIAGSFDYLLKIRTKDMSAYRELLGKVMSSLPHVDTTSTHVSMQAIKDIIS